MGMPVVQSSPPPGRPAPLLGAAKRLKRERNQARYERDRALAERDMAILERERASVDLAAYEALLAAAFKAGDDKTVG